MFWLYRDKGCVGAISTERVYRLPDASTNVWDLFYISLGKPASDKDMGHGNVLKKWPPASKLLFYYWNNLFKSFLNAASPEQKPLVPKEPVTRLIAKTTSPPTSPSPFQDKDMMKEEKPVVKLHPVQKAEEKSQPLVTDGNKKNELDNIRLKKTTKAPTVSSTNSLLLKCMLYLQKYSKIITSQL